MAFSSLECSRRTQALPRRSPHLRLAITFLLRFNGEDLRTLPLEERRARLRKALQGLDKALRFSEHLEGDGEAIFRHACALGLEGIVSKRRDARYRSGRSLTWLKINNPGYERR